MGRNHFLMFWGLCAAVFQVGAQNNCLNGWNVSHQANDNFAVVDDQKGLNERDDPSKDHTPLPLHWISFEGLEWKYSIVLRWVTTGELDVDYFEVESSLDNAQWNTLGRIIAHRKPDALNTYSFEDERNIRGVNYYRIRQVDNNHEVTYSRLISVKKMDRNRYYLINDRLSEFLIVVNATGEPVDVNALVFDLRGRLILEAHPTSSGYRVADLLPGMYVLKTPLQSFKFIKH